MTESAPGPSRTPASLAPWLSVDDGTAAVAYYTAAFGAVESYRAEDDAGRVIVARLTIDEADFWVQDEPGVSDAVGERPVRMILTVDDPDAAFRRAVDAGATEIAPVYEGHGWRIGRLADPFGHHWEVGKPLPDPPG